MHKVFGSISQVAFKKNIGAFK